MNHGRAGGYPGEGCNGGGSRRRVASLAAGSEAAAPSSPPPSSEAKSSAAALSAALSARATPGGFGGTSCNLYKTLGSAAIGGGAGGPSPALLIADQKRRLFCAWNSWWEMERVRAAVGTGEGGCESSGGSVLPMTCTPQRPRLSIDRIVCARRSAFAFADNAALDPYH